MRSSEAGAGGAKPLPYVTEEAPGIRSVCNDGVHLAAGASIEREYEARSGEQRPIDSSADDTYFLRTGIVLR